MAQVFWYAGRFALKEAAKKSPAVRLGEKALGKEATKLGADKLENTVEVGAEHALEKEGTQVIGKDATKTIERDLTDGLKVLDNKGNPITPDMIRKANPGPDAEGYLKSIERAGFDGTKRYGLNAHSLRFQGLQAHKSSKDPNHPLQNITMGIHSIRGGRQGTAHGYKDGTVSITSSKMGKMSEKNEERAETAAREAEDKVGGAAESEASDAAKKLEGAAGGLFKKL